MSCSNCFNGCAGPVSDKCVKYTGIDIPGLGIANGDTLLHVENKITEKILGLMTGEEIIPVIDPTVICDLVSDFFPYCPPLTLNDVLTAFVKAICVLDERIVEAEDQLAALNESYDIDCLVGVDASSDTHDVVQAVINKVCEVSAELTAFKEDVENLYVKEADIQGIVNTAISTAPGAGKNYDKMVPYIVYPYYGSIAKFGITGVGSDEWEKVYLCNGANGTPDMRGRVPVGVIVMGNQALESEVDPATPNAGNPDYIINAKGGSNLVKLTSVDQLPNHTHNPVKITITDPGHSHPNSSQNPTNGSGSVFGYNAVGDEDHFGLKSTESAPTGLKGGPGTQPTTVGQNVWAENTPVGIGAGHDNIQPVRALYYIMYKP